MNPSEQDAKTTTVNDPTTDWTITPPNLDDIDLDGLKAEDLESIDELMVRYDIEAEIEPDEVAAIESSVQAVNIESNPESTSEVDPSEDEDEDLAKLEQQIEIANQFYLTGRRAFESGYYRQAIANLERAAALSVGTSPGGGEIKIWLVLAYHAQGNLEAALSLCRKLTHHPHIPTRQQGRRLRAILEAPELAKRPEWFSKIPDLSEIDTSEGEAKKGASGTYKPRPIRPIQEPEIDPATINRRDNQFIWVAIAIVLGLLIYTVIG